MRLFEIGLAPEKKSPRKYTNTYIARLLLARCFFLGDTILDSDRQTWFRSAVPVVVAMGKICVAIEAFAF